MAATTPKKRKKRRYQFRLPGGKKNDGYERNFEDLPKRGKYQLVEPEILEDAIEVVTGKTIGELLMPWLRGRGRRREYALLMYCTRRMTPLKLMEIGRRYHVNRRNFVSNAWWVHLATFDSGSRKYDSVLKDQLDQVRAIVRNNATTSVKKNITNVKVALRRVYADVRKENGKKKAAATKKANAKTAKVAQRDAYLQQMRQEQAAAVAARTPGRARRSFDLPPDQSDSAGNTPQ